MPYGRTRVAPEEVIPHHPVLLFPFAGYDFRGRVKMDWLQYGKTIVKVGEKFGAWEVLNLWRHPKTNRAMANVECRCGLIASKELQQLTGKRGSRQCGKCPRIRGGDCYSPEYKVWNAARNRCHNPKAQAYGNYGERGIVMCERWRLSFRDFLEDMGVRPSKDHSLDRIDNNGNYEPENCQWTTRKKQAQNRRSTKLLTLNDVTLSVGDWEKRKGLAHHTINNRLKRGWSVEEAITTPKLEVTSH
jgi:hypothetical protein